MLQRLFGGKSAKVDPPNPAVLERLSTSERYIAFLLTALPKLQALGLYDQDTVERISRGAVCLHAIEQIAPEGDGLCLEFGVFKGGSLRACGEKLPARRFFGFDSFEGFPDDGRSDWKQDFTVEGLPRVPPNCHLMKGWFSDTLPGFLEEHPEPIDFINIDCDIYSSTNDVFTILEAHSRFRPGIVIFFDELINYSRYLWNEMLALFEMLERTGLGFEWIGAHQHVRLVEDSLVLLRDKQYPHWDDDLAHGYRQQASLVLTGDGIDYGPLHLDHYLARVKRLAGIFEDLGGDR